MILTLSATQLEALIDGVLEKIDLISPSPGHQFLIIFTNITPILITNAIPPQSRTHFFN